MSKITKYLTDVTFIKVWGIADLVGAVGKNTTGRWRLSRNSTDKRHRELKLNDVLSNWSERGKHLLKD